MSSTSLFLSLSVLLSNLRTVHSFSRGLYSARLVKPVNQKQLLSKYSSTTLPCVPLEEIESETETKIEKFSDRRPLLLLDIDGVINMIDSQGKGLGWPDRKKTRIYGFNIYWSEAMVKKINNWSDSGLAEIRWLTTWDHFAQTRLAPALGLNAFALGRQVKAFKDGGSDDFESKGDAVVNALKHCSEKRRKLVWVDDWASFEWKSRDEELYKTIGLVVQPKPDVGLSFDQVEEIENYLKARV